MLFDLDTGKSEEIGRADKHCNWLVPVKSGFANLLPNWASD
jgi:hypothetical protein